MDLEQESLNLARKSLEINRILNRNIRRFGVLLAAQLGMQAADQRKVASRLTSVRVLDELFQVGLRLESTELTFEDALRIKDALGDLSTVVDRRVRIW